MDADVFISLNHFKGHENAGFGGAIKNIGMGCGSRAGKCEQHISGQPTINEDLCRGCKKCMALCANDGLIFDETTKKMSVDKDHCLGCGRCIGACNFDAISFEDFHAPRLLNCKMAEYAKAVLDGRPHFHISLVVDVSPNCDCHAENDAPIVPNIGMLASFDMVALDKACADLVNKQTAFENSKLGENLKNYETGLEITLNNIIIDNELKIEKGYYQFKLANILSDKNINYLWISSLGLLINWYGDSMDGTLARVRNTQRPVFGYYLDHILDGVNESIMFIGAGVSALMHLPLALFVLLLYHSLLFLQYLFFLIPLLV